MNEFLDCGCDCWHVLVCEHLLDGTSRRWLEWNAEYVPRWLGGGDHGFVCPKCARKVLAGWAEGFIKNGTIRHACPLCHPEVWDRLERMWKRWDREFGPVSDDPTADTLPE
jgi:hypothetical protein